MKKEITLIIVSAGVCLLFISIYGYFGDGESVFENFSGDNFLRRVFERVGLVGPEIAKAPTEDYEALLNNDRIKRAIESSIYVGGGGLRGIKSQILNRVNELETGNTGSWNNQRSTLLSWNDGWDDSFKDYHAREAYIKKVAMSLYVEVNDLVPWSILDFSDEDLYLLLGDKYLEPGDYLDDPKNRVFNHNPLLALNYVQELSVLYPDEPISGPRDFLFLLVKRMRDDMWMHKPGTLGWWSEVCGSTNDFKDFECMRDVKKGASFPTPLFMYAVLQVWNVPSAYHHIALHHNGVLFPTAGDLVMDGDAIYNSFSNRAVPVENVFFDQHLMDTWDNLPGCIGRSEYDRVLISNYLNLFDDLEWNFGVLSAYCVGGESPGDYLRDSIFFPTLCLGTFPTEGDFYRSFSEAEIDNWFELIDEASVCSTGIGRPNAPDCSDGVDNDGDMRVDYSDTHPYGDPDCISADDDSEGEYLFPECLDGVDNDGDGHVDFSDDPYCQDFFGLFENPPIWSQGCIVDGNCNDWNPCNGVESCDVGTGLCVAGMPIQCDDGNACNGVEGCDVHTGECVAGADLDCDDGVDCTIDGCNAIYGCVYVSDSSFCDDGLHCTGVEKCLAGGCVSAGNPCFDGVACTQDSCNEGTDSCSNAPNDLYCDNGLFCDGVEVCDGVLGCLVGSGDPCAGEFCDDGGDVCLECLVDADCGDGDVCDGLESCNVGSCVGGVALYCDDENICTDDSCNVVLGCLNVDNTVACDDLIGCTTGDVCSAGTCSGITDGSLCQAWESCNPIADCQQMTCSNCEECDTWFSGCDYDECHNNCDWGNGCYFAGVVMLGDNCVDLASACGEIASCADYSEEECGNNPCAVAGALSGCEFDGSDCKQVPYCGDNSCDAGEDCLSCELDCGCSGNTPYCSGMTCVECVVGSSCDDGLFCNGAELCNSGVCGVGIPPVDDEVGCTNDYCDEDNDMVVRTPSDLNCDDDLFCNGVEFCDALLDCQAGILQCLAGENCLEDQDMCEPIPGYCDDNFDCVDGNVCTDDVCFENRCENNFNSVSCDDGIYCNGDDVCQEGSCVNVGINPCADSVGCTLDSCYEETDSCSHIGDNFKCDDLVYCNGEEICDGVLGCLAGVSPCNVGDVCDESNQCHLPNCNDNNVIDGTEQCDGIDLGELSADEICKENNYPSGGLVSCVDCVFDYTGCSLLPTHDNFDGGTSDFGGGVSGVEDVVLERSGFGKIDFGENVLNFERLDLDRYVVIERRKISVDTEGYGMSNLNVPAVLSFYGIGFAEPRILRNGVEGSDDCGVLDCEGGTCVVRVVGFSEYEVVGCGDGECNFGEDCSSCSLDCGVCPPPSSSSSSGGGGGGGGTPQCRDGRDNDGDGLVDYPEDKGCVSREDNSELDVGETGVCSVNWGCGDWSECVDGRQTRTCSDGNNCGTLSGKPTEVQECEMSLEGESGEAGEQESVPIMLRKLFFIVLGIFAVVILVVVIVGAVYGIKKRALRRRVERDFKVVGKKKLESGLK
ncbi:MAG: hypothetical protein ABIG28_01495 [archaeon]